MKRKLFLTILMTVMLGLTACGSTETEDEKDRKESSVEEDEDDEKEDEEEDDKKEDKKEDDKKEDDENEDDEKNDKREDVEPEDIEGADVLGAIFDTDIVVPAEVAEQYFDQMDAATGYLTDDVSELFSMLGCIGVNVEELSKEAMDAGTPALYYFGMYNQETAQLIDTGETDSYATQLVYDNESYYVLFGSEEADADEVEVFCQEGTTLEYWAVGMVQDDDYLLIPLFAGNAENGYYLVRPALLSAGFELPDMYALSDIGVDFTMTGDAGNSGSNGKSVEMGTEYVGEESITIEITDVVADPSGTTIVGYEITNTYPVDVIVFDESYTLNGEDITTSVIAYITADANGSTEDCLYINHYELKSGDELVMTAEVYDAETYDEIGEMEFVFNFE